MRAGHGEDEAGCRVESRSGLSYAKTFLEKFGAALADPDLAIRDLFGSMYQATDFLVLAWNI
jgi:hypothetical protein